MPCCYCYCCVVTESFRVGAGAGMKSSPMHDGAAMAAANAQANQALTQLQGRHAVLYEQQLGSKSKLGALLDYVPPVRAGARKGELSGSNRGQLDYLDVAVSAKNTERKADMMRDAFRHIVLQFRYGIAGLLVAAAAALISPVSVPHMQCN